MNPSHNGTCQQIRMIPLLRLLKRLYSINCNRRRVRCDFLGAASSSRTSPGDPSPQVARILHAFTDNDADGSIEPESASRLRSFPTDCPDLSKQERFLMAHLCGISDDLVAAGMQDLDFGLSLLPEFVTPSTRQGFVLTVTTGCTA